MAKYKSYNYSQTVMLPVSLEDQLVRRQMVVDKFDKKLRNTFFQSRIFHLPLSHNSQSTILCTS